MASAVSNGGEPERAHIHTARDKEVGGAWVQGYYYISGSLLPFPSHFTPAACTQRVLPHSDKYNYNHSVYVQGCHAPASEKQRYY